MTEQVTATAAAHLLLVTTLTRQAKKNCTHEAMMPCKLLVKSPNVRRRDICAYSHDGVGREDLKGSSMREEEIREWIGILQLACARYWSSPDPSCEKCLAGL